MENNNRRLALALALVVLVVLVTQFLFPQRRATTVTTPSAGAGAPPAAPASAPTAAPAPAPGVATPAAPAAAGAAPGAQPATIAAEAIVVGGSKAAFTISSAGAALVGAEMLGYRSLAPTGRGGGPTAQLAPPGEALVGYRIVVPGDTLVLARTPFTVTRPPASAGAGSAQGRASVVQLDGTAQTRAGAAVPVQFVYTFAPDSYVVHVRGTVQGVTGPAFLLVDLPSTLRVTEKDTLDHYTHLSFAVKPQTKDARGVPFAKLDPGERELIPGPIAWGVTKSKYFLVGALATPTLPFTELTAAGGVRTSKVATRGSATLVQALNNGGFGFDLYAGPQEWRHLSSMGRDFENANPYGGWLQGIVQPFATMVIRALLWMHDTFNLSYGWVLVVFGVLVRLLLWPLQQGAMRSQLKMQRVQPELQAVQERYKGDPTRLQQEMMKVYAAHGMSPFSALSGCLPMLIPLPIFFALFFVFQNTIEFRGVPFLWMSDISLKDPYYVLPVLVAVTQFLISWIGMRGMPPNPQAQMLTYAMPAMFLFFFINVAAGLNLYYLTQNIIMLPQQYLLANERKKQQGAPVVQGTPTPKPGPGGPPKQGSPLRKA